MSINFETATLAQLVAHFNALPGVKPVKKFASKADAIKRIEAVQSAAPEDWDQVEGGGEVVEDPAVEEPADATEVQDPAVEGGETAEEPAEEPAEETEDAASPAAGFKYLTRDELKALAETDPEARAAYRKERRLAARKARKAKKSVAKVAPATEAPASEEPAKVEEETVE